MLKSTENMMESMSTDLQAKVLAVEKRLAAQFKKLVRNASKLPQVTEDLATRWPLLSECDYHAPNISGTIDLNEMEAAMEVLDRFPPIKKHFLKLCKHVSKTRVTSQRGSYVFIGAASGLPVLHCRVLKALLGYFGKKATPFVDTRDSETWQAKWRVESSNMATRKTGGHEALDGAMLGISGLAPFKWIFDGKMDNAALVDGFYMTEDAEIMLKRVDEKGMERFARACTKAKLDKADPYLLIGASIFGIGNLNERLLGLINADTFLRALTRSPLLGKAVLFRDYNTTSKDVRFVGEAPLQTIVRLLRMLDDLFLTPAMEVARYIRDDPDRTTGDDVLLLKHAVKSLQAKLSLDTSRSTLHRVATSGYGKICKSSQARGQELRLWMIGFASWWTDSLKSTCGQSMTSSLTRLTINRSSIESLGRWFDLVADSPESYLRATRINLNERLDDRALKKAELLRKREEESDTGATMTTQLSYRNEASSLAYWTCAKNSSLGSGFVEILDATHKHFVCKKNCTGAGEKCYHCVIRNLQEALVEVISSAKQQGISLANSKHTLRSGRPLPYPLPRYCL